VKTPACPRWDPSFFRASPLFWPIARAAAALERYLDWPEPEDLTALFERDPPVRFERATPAPRRGTRRARRSEDTGDMRYDARIAVARRVPTRSRSWHDVTNALVWVTFPRAKLALHERQHAMISARLGADLRLPGARSREQDAVAMLDEGGVALLCARGHRDVLASALEGRAGRAGLARCEALASLVSGGLLRAAVFGHGIYEGLASGGLQSVCAAGYVIEVDADAIVPGDVGDRDHLACADAALASLLAREAPIGRADFAPVSLP
jgi:hypothetical protein